MLPAALALPRGRWFLQAIRNTGPAEPAGQNPAPSWPFLFLEGNSGCYEEGYAAMKTDHASQLPGRSTSNPQAWPGWFRGFPS